MLTGLVIASTGVLGTVDPATGKLVSGAQLTILAFSSVFGDYAKLIVSIALSLFAFSTILGWEYYGEEALEKIAQMLALAFNSGVFTFHIHFGVYRIDDASIPVSVMCGRANSALRTIREDMTRIVAYFDDTIRQELLLEQEVLSGFDEAKLGERGLTFDCGSYDVTIAQSFADKDDATGRGRLILTGETGSVRLTGDLSGLSTVEVRGGTVNILGRTVGNLVLNGGVLKVDPANPITVNGALVLDSPRLALASGMTIGTTSSVFKTSSPLGEEALAKWAEAIAVSGLADGAACTFAQKATADGYELTVEVREARTTEIRLDSGVETRSGDYMNAPADSFSIVVAKDAALTLSGNLKSGAMEKTSIHVSLAEESMSQLNR
jgi:hypothetical protein